MASFIQSIFKKDRGTPTPKPQSQRDKEFIAQALERFKLCQEAEAQIRKDALDDFKFLVGQQWDDDVWQSRQTDGRPCLTMNRLRQFRRMVTNEQRQQRPSIQINPVGDEADIDTAEVLQGLCRHVEINSKADIAYDTGFEHMVTGGFGYWRIVTDYVDDDSDEQEIYIKRIKNPFTVYFDQRAVEPDYCDALYAFIIEDLPTETYRAEFPDSSLASFTEMVSLGDMAPGWITRDTIRVAEYFYVELEPRPDEGRRSKRTVKWAKINAIEPLDERDVPCRFIPIVPVLGDDTMVDGKRNLVGLIRDAKDPQRMYNFQISAAAEMIALAPKAPNIAAEGQLEGHYAKWEQSNRRNFAVLEYKPVSSANGAPMPPPQRNTAEPPIMAMSHMIAQADNDLKATTGIYDASLGQQGPEQSGKAVMLRQKQSDIANLNYTDNQARAIRLTGDILLDMFRNVYTTAQIRRIINPDQSVSHRLVWNSKFEDEPDQSDFASQNGNVINAPMRAFDIGAGRYDVTVSVGPSYQSKRQEAVASELALVQSYPPLMNIAGDLIVRNMDWPFASEIADRMKAMLPPQLQDQAQQQQMQAAQQAQMLQAQNQQLVQVVEQQNQIIKQKLVESQSKETIALIQQETQLNVARINASKDQDTAQADRETDMLQTMMGHAHEAGMQQQDQAHEAGMQQDQQQHEQDMQQQQAQMAAQQQQPSAPGQPAASGPGPDNTGPPNGGASPSPGGQP